jgi:hypothetical protein
MDVYVEKIFSAQDEHRAEKNILTLADYQRMIQNCENNDVIIMGDPHNIKGVVKIKVNDFRQEQSKRKNLLYNISLPPDYVIELPKNHMLTQLTGPPDGALRYYSMTLRPLSRADLGREMVYIYESNTANNTYTARPYKPYEEFFNEHFAYSEQPK